MNQVKSPESYLVYLVYVNVAKDRLLGQTSNLGRVEPTNWSRPKNNFNFLPNQAKYTLSNIFFLIYSIDVLEDPNSHSDELNRARFRTFHELNSKLGSSLAIPF